MRRSRDAERGWRTDKKRPAARRPLGVIDHVDLISSLLRSEQCIRHAVVLLCRSRAEYKCGRASVISRIRHHTSAVQSFCLLLDVVPVSDMCINQPRAMRRLLSSSASKISGMSKRRFNSCSASRNALLDNWIKEVTGPSAPVFKDSDVFHAIRAKELALTLPKWAAPSLARFNTGYATS